MFVKIFLDTRKGAMDLNNFLTIDPGVHTGLAFWKNEKTMLPETEQINNKTTSKIPMDKVTSLNNQFWAYLQKNKQIEFCIIEGVQYWENSSVSRVAGRRGDLTFLSYLCGSYYQTCKHEKINAFIIPPYWKGQLNYDNLSIWIEKLNNKIYSSEHITSAVGIGFFVKGEIFKGKVYNDLLQQVRSVKNKI